MTPDTHSHTHVSPSRRPSSNAQKLRVALCELDEVDSAHCTEIGDEFFVQVRGHNCVAKVAQLAEFHQPAGATLRLVFTEV